MFKYSKLQMTFSGWIKVRIVAEEWHWIKILRFIEFSGAQIKIKLWLIDLYIYLIIKVDVSDCSE